MRLYLRRIEAAKDSGVALVAAIGVAVVGAALSVTVLAQAIQITNDSARDRIRTVEVHAAEAALDSALGLLETTTPCGTTETVGQGATAVDVTVSIQYYDGTSPTPMTCSAGILADDPVQAVVTSVASPVLGTAAGIVPERRMQAVVNLNPLSVPDTGVAIFSGGQMNVANSGELLPLNPADSAQIWIDDTDVNCSNSVVIDGDLIITGGGLNISNTCRITGDLWVRDTVNASNNVNPYRVGGDVVVYLGNMQASNNQKFGGSLSVGGNLNGTYSAEGAICADNLTPCGTLPLMEPRGMPTVLFVASDWTSRGFTIKPAAGADPVNDPGWAKDVIDSGAIPSKKQSSFLGNPCTLTGSSVVKNPVVLTDQKTVYDLTSCGSMNTSGVITLEIEEDTAFFIGGLNTSGSFTVKSHDGNPHHVWFIVPSNLAGGINMSNTSNIIDPVHVFLFTPQTLNFANSQNMVGQAYALHINGSNSLNFQYVGMGIPGVDLGSTATTANAGFSVEIVSKHELPGQTGS